ncbi:MAG: hypothetical protein RL033_868 [Pseudomonadota bacterium]|jgi:hypothetical protein
MTLGAARLALSFSAVGVLVFACSRRACRSLGDCDLERCAVLSALALGKEQPQPVGCVTKEQDSAPGVSTYARDGAGACWIFPTTLVAEGYSVDDSCRP